MHRRQLLASVGAGATTALAGCLDGVDEEEDEDGSFMPPGELRNPGFEERFRGWVIGRDVPRDPNTGNPVESFARVVSEPVSEGDHSLELFVDGQQGEATIWAQQAVDLSAARRLSFDVYSPEESADPVTTAAAYAGPIPDRGYLGEEQFDTERPVESHSGWETFEYEFDFDGVGLVAVGVNVVREAEVARGIDDVRLGGD